MTGAPEMAPRNIDVCESTVLLFRSELSTLDFLLFLVRPMSAVKRKPIRKEAAAVISHDHSQEVKWSSPCQDILELLVPLKESKTVQVYC